MTRADEVIAYREELKELNGRTPDGGDPRFRAVLDRIWQMHLAKSHDYGQDDDIYANVRASEKFGVPAWLGAVIRANDKMHRLAVYADKGELKNEKVEDTFDDLASYAIIAAVLFDEVVNNDHSGA